MSTAPTKQSMEQAGLVELCSGCEMAGRMCDDCLDYPQARINIARALDAAREDERKKADALVAAFDKYEALLDDQHKADCPEHRDGMPEYCPNELHPEWLALMRAVDAIRSRGAK